ncbi:hypothetical protein EJ02DRAFT_463129 [Clathrospora elynae]|uniref:Uncharacterized protein n=1 Tax=Clathrospora elynae TaxID=706981 RepID=A0A6A5T0T1_9PLEO|nr:hypothetical protein EJ02DRAFT_463129 [Clathrospora elynae]
MNQSLLEIDPELAKMFWGSAIVWAGYCAEDILKTADLNLRPADLRHAVNEMKVTYCKVVDSVTDVVTRATVDPVLTVRLNCKGDNVVIEKPTHRRQIEKHSILDRQSEISTPIADKLGLPLIVLKERPGLSWRDRHFDVYMENCSAAILNPPHQPSHTGTLLIVRKDGKPLHPTHLLALTIYTGERLKDSYLLRNAYVTASMLNPSRLNQVSKEDFQRWYYGEWMTYLLGDRSAPSPFDIDGYNGPVKDINIRCEENGWYPGDRAFLKRWENRQGMVHRMA